MEYAALIINSFFPSILYIYFVIDCMFSLILETASLVIKDYFIKHFMQQPFISLSDNMMALMIHKCSCFFSFLFYVLKWGPGAFLREFKESLKWFYAKRVISLIFTVFIIFIEMIPTGLQEWVDLYILQAWNYINKPIWVCLILNDTYS